MLSCSIINGQMINPSAMDFVNKGRLFIIVFTVSTA